MKLKIDSFEVEIKAKREGENRNNENATMHLLNLISLACGEAVKSYDWRDKKALANQMQEISDEIYGFLSEKEFYSK